MKKRMVMVLSSIVACRKAIDFLKEVGEFEGVEIRLHSAKDPCQKQQPNEPLYYQGHRIVPREGNKLVCLSCGKEYHIGHRVLTQSEQYALESLLPKTHF